MYFVLFFPLIRLILYFHSAISTAILSYFHNFPAFPKVKRFVFVKKKDRRGRFQNSVPSSAVNHS